MVKLKEFFIYHGHLYLAKVVHGFLINTIGKLKRGYMKSEHKEYILEILLERLSFFDEMSEQEWIDRNDPKGKEMKLLSEIISNF